MVLQGHGTWQEEVSSAQEFQGDFSNIPTDFLHPVQAGQWGFLTTPLLLGSLPHSPLVTPWGSGLGLTGNADVGLLTLGGA